MPKIRYKKTELIDFIIKNYTLLQQPVANPKNDSLENSITFENDKPDGWIKSFGEKLGLTYQDGHIEGNLTTLLTPWALTEYTAQLIKKDNTDKIKSQCAYYESIYNTCAQYIADNQKRFRYADLNNIGHGKVFAMVLIAHMCKQALTVLEQSDNIQEQTYRQRIKKFTETLLNNPEITESRSNDSKLLSCASALNNIANANYEAMNNNNKDLKKIDKFFNSALDTINSSKDAIDGINNYLLPLLVEQSLKAGKALNNILNNTTISLSSQEKSLKTDPLINELYKKPHDILAKEKEGYLTLYQQGIDYNLELKNNSYLLKKLNNTQRKNLKQLLQLRDQLQVLTEEFEKLYELSAQNKTSYLNDFIKLADPYLKSIHRVRGELELKLEQFKADCNTVYHLREKDNSFFPAQRKTWESFYRNKSPLVNCEKLLGKLATNVARTLSKIPFNFYQSFAKINENVKDIFKKGKALFHEQFKFNKDHNIFKTAIEEGQTRELERQTELVLIKLQDAANECKDLIEQAEASVKNSTDNSFNTETSTIISTLKETKISIEKMLSDVTDKQDQAMAKIKSSDEPGLDDSWVILDSGLTKAEQLLTEQANNTSYYQWIRGYISGASNKNQINPEEHERLKQELLEAKNELLTIQETNQKLAAQLVDIDILNKKETAIQLIAAKQKNIHISDIVNSPVLEGFQQKAQTKLSFKLSLPLYDSTQIVHLLKNVTIFLEQLESIKEHYENNACKQDKSRFFSSHNQNGVRHAEQVVCRLTIAIKKATQDRLNELIQSDSGILSTNDIQLLAQNIAHDSYRIISQCIAKEHYSGYKQYSFRNYLSHFHSNLQSSEQLMKNLSFGSAKDALKDITKQTIDYVADDHNTVVNTTFKHTATQQIELNLKRYQNKVANNLRC